MIDTNPDLDLCQLEAIANAEAKMQADAGFGDGSTYDDRLANLRERTRRVAGLGPESSYQTDQSRSGLQFHDEPGK